MAPPQPKAAPPEPIAAPRRGKFLSAPSSSAPETSSSQTRGKFLGNKPPSSSPSSGLHTSTSFGSTAGGDDEDNSLDNLKSHVHNSRVAAMSRRKAIAGQRKSIITDLDEAENIVLSLLECASSVASDLSEMTTAKSKKMHGKKSDNNRDEEEGGKVDASFEQLTANVRSNGVGYLAGVKKLHELLAPHSSLVKSYKNHDGEPSATEKNNKEHLHKSFAAVAGGNSSASSKIIQEATSNMYAVRVKKRLAMERKDIMKEMIRLEEELDGDGCSDIDMELDSSNTNTAGSKRKHKSIEEKG